jgi:hypothetical protein
MVKKGTDQLSSGLIGDTVGQLDRASRDILASLKELASFHKERYKLELRQIVMPGLPIDADMAIGRRDEAMRLIKHKFAEVSSERSYYPELIEELLQEDFSSDSPSLREEVLSRLAVAEEKKEEAKKERSFKGIVIEGIKSLAAAAYALGEATAKLSENSGVLQSLDQGLGARLKRMIRRLFAPEDRGLVYSLAFADPVTGSRSREDLDFGAFVEEIGNKARFLASLGQRGSSGKRLEGMSDEQAYNFLQRNIEELQRVLRVLAALEDYFKAEAPADVKPRIRSVRVEMTTVKGAVIKANQKKHEYVAQREELEQMRRLGIKDPG